MYFLIAVNASVFFRGGHPEYVVTVSFHIRDAAWIATLNDIF